MKKVGIARAHTNIALVKYWGKQNEKLFLPMNGSLSLTLDAFYTDTKVVFDETLTRDSFWLNEEKQEKKETDKITDFLDLFRQAGAVKSYAAVLSYNHVPTAAGLASSASAFAALAGAANQAIGLDLSGRVLSTYARRGSGSATRSIFGGFVEWQKGTKNSDSFAIPIDAGNWDIGMVIVAINKKKKKLSSREGMRRTAATSPFYSAWVKSAEEDLIAMRSAIKNHDFEKLGWLTESNSMKMHGMMFGALPPICYFEPDSIRVLQKAAELRNEGILCYTTMDAGPNVKILCQYSDTEKIREALLEEFDTEKIIISGVGPDMKLLSEEEWQAH